MTKPRCKSCNTQYAIGNTSTAKGKKGRVKNYCFPKILSCGHIFCEDCVSSKLLTSSSGDDSGHIHTVTCAVTSCQASSALTDQELKSLPVLKHLIGSIALEDTVADRNIDRLLWLADKTSADLVKDQPPQEKCLHCQRAVAQVVCEKCDGVQLCRRCFTDIHKSVVFASHKPSDIGGAANKSLTQNVDLKIDSKCPDHPEKIMEYFCKDCHTAMCSDCGVLGSHSGHSVNHLSIVNKAMRCALLETRRQAAKAVDVVNHTQQAVSDINRSGHEFAGGGDGQNESSTTQKVEEVFLHLHALLQLKQKEVQDKVSAAAGNNKTALRNMEKEVVNTKMKFEHLLCELDRLLSNPAYEKTCDFARVNSVAQQLLKLPCHLVVNDISQSPDLQVSINSDILSSLSDIVSVSAQSTSVDRYELKRLEEVSESDLQSITNAHTSPPNGHSSQPFALPLSQQSADSELAYSPVSLSSQFPRYRKLSGHSPTSVDYTHGGRQPPIIDPYSQQNRRVQHPPPTQPFYEDNFSGISYFGDPATLHNSQQPHRGNYSNRRQQSHYGSAVSPQADMDRLSSTSNDAQQAPFFNLTPPAHRPAYTPSSPSHKHGIGGQRGQRQSPSRRNATPSGDSYDNFELSARQNAFAAKSADSQHMFGGRDTMLESSMYPPAEGYISYYNPTRCSGAPNIHQLGNQLSTSNRTVEAGRDMQAPSTPLDVQVRPLGPQKKLFMRGVETFFEKSLSVKVTHIQSPACIYVQHPSKVKALHKLKQRIVEHCESTAPLLNLHGVKFVVARVNGTWRRGQVMKILDRAVRVFCCDYGYTADILPTDLRPTYGGLLSVPMQAIKCQLQGIQPADGSCDWPAECASAMREVMNKMCGVTLVKLDSGLVEADNIPVDLLLRDLTTVTTLSLRDFLVFSELAVWDSPTHPYIADQKLLTRSFPSLAPICGGSYMRMFVTHVVSPDEFYAQIVNRELDESDSAAQPDQQFVTLGRIMESMNEKYSDVTSDMLHKVFVPKPGDAVAASYEGGWFRAQILALQPSHVKVKYVDYGNIEIVPRDQIRVLFNDCKILPAQAVKLRLHCVAPLSGKKWSGQLCEGFSELCLERMCKCKVMSGSTTTTDGLSTVMVMEDTGENIANLLVQTGLATRANDTVTEHEGIDYTWTHVESPSEIYVQTAEAALKAAELVQELTAVMEEGDDSMNKEEWKTGERCAVKHAGKWVRGKVMDVTMKTSRCKLQLMDSGIVVVKTLADLRVLPEIASGPALIQVASIAGITPSGDSKLWGPTAKDTIKELLEPYESFKLVPKAEAAGGVLPCDFLLPVELPRKYPSFPADIQFTSIKSMLLESGVALRHDTRTTTNAKKPTKHPSTAANFSKNFVVEKSAKSKADTPAEEKVATPSQNSSVGSGEKLVAVDSSHNASGATGSADRSSPVSDGLSADAYTTGYSGAATSAGQPVTVDISSSVTSTRTTLRPLGVSGSRLMKSPGGSIRSEGVATSQNEQEPTDQLLAEAASRLAVDCIPKVIQGGREGRSRESENSSTGSSSDMPTPELQLLLNRLVGNPNQ